MWEAFINIAANLGVSIEDIILLVVMLSGIIAAAKSFKLAVVYWFITSGLCFITFYAWAQTDASIVWGKALIAFFMSLVVMALTMYPIAKTTDERGII